jgi:NADH-quinone oxidoreductase subunit L
MPVTHWTFLCGALALAAVPPLAGFWSKDEIVTAIYEASHLEHLSGERVTYLTLFILAMGTAFLTAFYTFRAYFRTFWGELKVPPDAGSHHGHSEPEALATDHHGPVAHASGSEGAAHAHESPPVMTIPLIVLALGAVFGGLAAGSHGLGHFLPNAPAYRQYLPPPHEHAPNWTLMVVSGLISLAGIGLAYVVYVRNAGAEERFAESYPRLYGLSQNRFYIDEIYNAIIVLPSYILAKLSAFFDTAVDGVVDLVGALPGWIGAALRPIQNGLVQFYALAMMLGLAVFLGILTLRAGR